MSLAFRKLGAPVAAICARVDDVVVVIIHAVAATFLIMAPSTWVPRLQAIVSVAIVTAVSRENVQQIIVDNRLQKARNGEDQACYPSTDG